MHRRSTAQAGDSLIRAREVAQKARDLLRQDIDPLVAREQQREAERLAAEDGESQPGVALELTGRRYHGTTVAGCAGTGQAAECARNLKGGTVPETLRRIRQRLESLFEDAQFHERCTGNPAAAVRRKLREQLPSRAREPLKALPCREAPAPMAGVR